MESSNNDDNDSVKVGEIDGKILATPVHMQATMKHLQLKPLLDYIQNLLKDEEEDEKPSRVAPVFPSKSEAYGLGSEGVKIIGGVPITRAERIADRTRLYNFSRVRKKRKWMKNILVEDSSEEEEEGRDQRIHHLLKMHKYRRSCSRDFQTLDQDRRRYMYYSSSVLSNVDVHNERTETDLATRVKTESSQQTESQASDEELDENEEYSDWLRFRHNRRKRRRLSPEQVQAEQRNIWSSICKYCIPTAHKARAEARRENMAKLRKVSNHCMRECRRVAMQSHKLTKESVTRARKLAREAANYWRKKDRVDRETKRKNEKEADEQRKQDIALMEAQRHQRKLNFLITQTELYAHFMARKITGHGEDYQRKILDQLPDENSREHWSGDSSPYDFRSAALANAQDAFNLHTSKRRAFANVMDTGEALDEQRQQPALFSGTLKAYQLEGMNWLIRLYEEGLNGILADEMGLGKTIQSLAFLGYIAETCNIWGPFLIVAPASTLHNWQQECARFLPKLNCVPYWGNAQDRRVLRKFWETSGISTETCSFHMVITSYQIVVQDVKYFQKVDWHYLILDEAQAIKSSSSARWKILLSFSCRNRLLLTGTPIQNNMAELWSLLHFIMPTLFDCHEEFNEWFSKDIENHAENKKLPYDEIQLSRLHMILSPFMLRREKREVENQLSEKIEIVIQCPLTSRQKLLYDALKNKISIDDLVISSRVSAQTINSTNNALMNLVMQFRKVCNHPNLVDRRDTHCGMKLLPELYVVPRLLYSLWRPKFNHILYNRMYVHHSANVANSLRDLRMGNSSESTFSFLRFVGLSEGEFHRIYSSLMLRWLSILHYWKMVQKIHLAHLWDSDCQKPSTSFLLDCTKPTSRPNVMTSSAMMSLVFTSTLMTSHGHVDHTVRSLAEAKERGRLGLRSFVKEPRRRSPRTSTSISPRRSPARMGSPSRSAPVSPSKSRQKSPVNAEDSKKPPTNTEESTSHSDKTMYSRTIPLLLTAWPKFTYLRMKNVHFPPRSWYCPSRRADFQKEFESTCGSVNALRTLLYGSAELFEEYEHRSERFSHCPLGGLLGTEPVHGYSSIVFPDKESLVTDAGKLNVLDHLLIQLRSEGHRVLIYSQMTKMIDILEEYMWHRKHTYIRLDGSSKISDRRDMIADFQTREDIFIFLLSTRAGGLGINLTAADTVIFYDSDWNPAVDKQAMDRTHRLGQTRQVTVYRLITENTIEQRILDRAETKSQIQNMVMKGSAVRPDDLKPTEVVTLLLDDEEMQSKFNEKNETKRLRLEAKRRSEELDTEALGATSRNNYVSSRGLDNGSDSVYLAEESAGCDSAPKRRGRPTRNAALKRPLSAAMAKLTSGSGVELVEETSNRTATLRTRTSNQVHSSATLGKS